MKRLNSLEVIVYSGTTVLDRFLVGTNHAGPPSFETQYPCGLYGSMSFLVARDILSAWGIRGANRISIYNGIIPVYEGRITNLKNAVAGQGANSLVQCAGMWGDLLNREWLDGMWCDTRMDAANWKPQLWLNASGKVIWWQQDARLRMTPKAEAFTNGQYSSMRYDTPPGMTIKRITYDYDLQEGAQAWGLQVWNGDGGGVEAGTDITASGTGSKDITLATATSWLELIVYSAANQTPTSDGSIYGEFSNMCIYYETGGINLTEICKDVIGFLPTVLNSDISRLASNTLTLVPFSVQGTAAKVLSEAASYGGPTSKRWAVGVKHSDLAIVPDGKPVLYAEQFPDLTDYDYVVSMAEANIQLAQNFDTIVNWVVVEYKNPNGDTLKLTPDTDATLKDDASILQYGKRLPPGGSIKTEANATLALALGQMYLAANKDPSWTASGPIHIKGYVRHKQQFRVPASQVEAGKRLRIENALADLSGSGLTFLISKTSYNDAAETCDVTIGRPDDLISAVNQMSENEEG